LFELIDVSPPPPDCTLIVAVREVTSLSLIPFDTIPELRPPTIESEFTEELNSSNVKDVDKDTDESPAVAVEVACTGSTDFFVGRRLYPKTLVTGPNGSGSNGSFLPRTSLTTKLDKFPFRIACGNSNAANEQGKKETSGKERANR
jgi:hypothetical protein